MPSYFFDVTDAGSKSTDSIGVELVDLEAARREALTALADMARDEVLNGAHVRDLLIDVRDREGGPVLLTASLSLQVSRQD